MLKSRAEIKEFIETLFASSEIIINGHYASIDDLVALCERVSAGKENINPPRCFMSAGKITKYYVTTI